MSSAATPVSSPKAAVPSSFTSVPPEFWIRPWENHSGRPGGGMDTDGLPVWSVTFFATSAGPRRS